MKPVVIDTNVFIAAAFNPHSSAAQVIEAAQEGTLKIVWDEKTKHETQKLVTQIPMTRKKWPKFEKLFQGSVKHHTKIAPEAFKDTVKDRDDRKFAALAKDTGAIIVTNDDDLLGTKNQTGLTVMTPGEFVRTYLQGS
ncbi:MAG: hypothetical protein JWL85_677 [Candidatus Saccharibacteria bacterium]|nr:hypothetical protein [Candidatus Saccharibacteria bacterium]